MILYREYISTLAVVVVSIGFIHGVGAREGFEDLLESDPSNEDINGFVRWRRSAENGDIDAAELIKEVSKVCLVAWEDNPLLLLACNLYIASNADTYGNKHGT
jgi:hypothetical protein